MPQKYLKKLPKFNLEKQIDKRGGVFGNNVSRIKFLLNNNRIPPDLIKEKMEELSLRRIIQLYLTNQYVISYIKDNFKECILLYIYISDIERKVLREISGLTFQFTKEKSN